MSHEHNCWYGRKWRFYLIIQCSTEVVVFKVAYPDVKLFMVCLNTTHLGQNTHRRLAKTLFLQKLRCSPSSRLLLWLHPPLMKQVKRLLLRIFIIPSSIYFILFEPTNFITILFSSVTEETNKSLILNTEVVCKTLADLLRQFGLTMGANIVKKIISV